MSRYQWMRPRQGSKVHAFSRHRMRKACERYDRDGRKDDPVVPVTVWAWERKCGYFTFSALVEPNPERDDLCPFCMRAVRRDWLFNMLRDCVIVVFRPRWPVRRAARRVEHWLERRLWGRP